MSLKKNLLFVNLKGKELLCYMCTYQSYPSVSFEIAISRLPGHLQLQNLLAWNLSPSFFCSCRPQLCRLGLILSQTPADGQRGRQKLGQTYRYSKLVTLDQTGHLSTSVIGHCGLDRDGSISKAKWASYCLFGINYQGEWKPPNSQSESRHLRPGWEEGECITRAMATELGQFRGRFGTAHLE